MRKDCLLPTIVSKDIKESEEVNDLIGIEEEDDEEEGNKDIYPYDTKINIKQVMHWA